jgi:hypothetical protein
MFMHLIVGVPPELAKQPAIGCTCALISGTAEVPGEQAGERARFNLDWHLQSCRTVRSAYIWKVLLGEGSVHDVGTLVAALTSSQRYVRVIAEPAPVARVAELREVPLVFKVTECV